MKRIICLVVLSVVASTGFTQTNDDTVTNAPFGYEVTMDVIYGQGAVTIDREVVDRDLKMDVYQPTDSSFAGPRPAVVLIHGGAFSQGGRRQPPYREAGAVHSRQEDYARLLTPLGYVCFVIEYRLSPELPIPALDADTDGLQALEEGVTVAALNRVNFARGHIGLPPLRDDQRYVIWNGMLSAAEDLDKAVRFVRANALRFGVNPDKIAMGGHSAGATTVLNAGYGLKTPVIAMFPLSPAVAGFEMQRVIEENSPATLLMISQFDDSAILEGIPSLISALRTAGTNYQLAWVPGFGHFYPTGAVSLADDGSRTSVGERVIKFLDQLMK